MTVKEYYADSDGNLYYILKIDVEGGVNQRSNGDYGTSSYPGYSLVSDDVIREIFESKATLGAGSLRYDDTPETSDSKKIMEITMHLGHGEDTKIEYYGRTIVYLSKTNVTTADRFGLHILTKNTQTDYLGDATSNIFNYYGFDKGKTGFYRFARVAIVDENDVLVGINLWFIETFTGDDGTRVWGVVSDNIIGAGRTAYNGDWVRCKTNDNERIVWDDEFKKVTDDDTPDTKPDGGFGGGQNPTDKIPIPPLPNINLNVTGSSLYRLTEQQMSAFTAWLWTSDWQENIKKLRNNPIENIISVSVINVPVEGVTANIMLGNVDSNISASIIPRWASVDCGTISIDEFYGTFADYEPYVDFKLYLPKIGFISIPADIIVNNNLSIIYHIELASGEGICFVYVTNKRNGVSYIYNTYTCSCASNVTLSASDHTRQIQTQIDAMTTIPLAVASANPTAIASSVVSNAVNVATAKNPTDQLGRLGNMSSLMSHNKPYILINATNLTKPAGYKENNGHAIYATYTLSTLKGYVQTLDYHANFSAPESVRSGIETILNNGFYIE